MSADRDVAVERAREWIATHCRQCGRPAATDADWNSTSGGARPDLCWEPIGQCPWRFHDLDPLAAMVDAILAGGAS